jgi:hypothetical protein
MKASSFRARGGRRALALVLLGALFAAPSAFGGQRAAVARKPVAALSQAERALAARVRVGTIRLVTTRLASPAMEGRGTASPGGERAARYLAARFAAFRLKPLGDSGSYLQAVKFWSGEVLPTSSVRVGEVSLELVEDFVVAALPAGDVDARAGLVFAGYGVVAPDLQRDDLAGVDVAGKIVVVLDGLPKGVDKTAWQRAAAPKAVVGGLAQRGAVGVIRLLTASSQLPYERAADYFSRRRVRLAGAPDAAPPVSFTLLASPAAGERLLTGPGGAAAELTAKAERGEIVSRDLGTTATVALRVKRGEAIGSNVAGVLEGSDPALKAEAVVFSAHYDAFGTGAGGRIYPGAADNALGVGTMAAVAQALARSPRRPRRSLIFLAVTGDEYGLLGAKHWVTHPTWPLERVAAVINFDGIGTEVYGPVERIVGFGAEHSDLGGVLERVVAASGKTLAPDPFPEENVFTRSDHFAFVERGIPALMPLGGPGGSSDAFTARARKWLTTDYHQTTDTVRPDWHWDGARALAAVAALVGRRVANADAMPAWLPDSPFNRPRGNGALTSFRPVLVCSPLVLDKLHSDRSFQPFSFRPSPRSERAPARVARDGWIVRK